MTALTPLTIYLLPLLTFVTTYIHYNSNTALAEQKPIASKYHLGVFVAKISFVMFRLFFPPLSLPSYVTFRDYKSPVVKCWRFFAS